MVLYEQCVKKGIEPGKEVYFLSRLYSLFYIRRQPSARRSAADSSCALRTCVSKIKLIFS